MVSVVVTAPNDLSLRQLQYAVAVADTLGFHKAAAQCHVSQPALSAQIQQLETVLGVRLFERDRRRVIITAAGAEIVRRARQILVDTGDLISAAARVREPFTGMLRIGVIPTVAPYLLPEVMPELATKYPRLSLVFREEKTADIIRAVSEGALDAGLLALEGEIGDCARAEIARDVFVAALPKGHPLAKKKILSVGDLKDASVLLLDEGHCFRDQALALCAKAHGAEANVRATSLSTLAQMVSCGTGITLLPELAVSVENRRAQLEIRPFARPAPGRTIGLVWRPRSPFGREFQELAMAFRQAVERLRGLSVAVPARPVAALSSRRNAGHVSSLRR
jgi:LysR family transcriptional regulator, hydrogen peroxide-inducible genes activator